MIWPVGNDSSVLSRDLLRRCNGGYMEVRVLCAGVRASTLQFLYTIRRLASFLGETWCSRARPVVRLAVVRS